MTTDLGADYVKCPDCGCSSVNYIHWSGDLCYADCAACPRTYGIAQGERA